MSQRLRVIIFLWLLFFLSGCASAIAPVSTEFSIILKDNTIQPGVWRVPTGAILTLHLSNQDTTAHELLLLFRTTTTLTESGLEASIFWSHSIPAGQSETVQLKSPTAAGDYELVGRENLENGMIAKMVVVNVDEVQAVSP